MKLESKLANRLATAKSITPTTLDIPIELLCESSAQPIAVFLKEDNSLADQVFEYHTGRKLDGERHPFQFVGIRLVAIEMVSKKDVAKMHKVVKLDILGKPIEKDAKTGDPARNKDGSFKFAEITTPDELMTELSGAKVPTLMTFRVIKGRDFQSQLDDAYLLEAESHVPEVQDNYLDKQGKAQTAWVPDWDVIPKGRNALMNLVMNSLAIGIEQNNPDMILIKESISTKEYASKKNATEEKDGHDDQDKLKQDANAAADAPPVGPSIE